MYLAIPFGVLEAFASSIFMPTIVVLVAVMMDQDVQARLAFAARVSNQIRKSSDMFTVHRSYDLTFFFCCCCFAALRPIVGIASRAIATRNFSVCGRAFAFAVTAAVVFLARVHFGAAIHAIVDVASRAIATRNSSVCGRAFAFAVTAAVVCLARVLHFAASIHAIVDIASRAIATRNSS